MAHDNSSTAVLCACAVTVLMLAGSPLRADDTATHKLKAWHERLPSQTREITLPETGEIKVDFTLGITNLPKP